MQDPIQQFAEWFAEAKATPAVADATAMVLATATHDGKPAARVVLLKDFSEAGFVFYGNMESRKFRELAANPFAALDFYWAPLNKQVRIEGGVTRVSEAEADAYFASRPRQRQIGAWTSEQSRPLASREAMEARYVEFEKKFAGADVPRPPHWSGWRLAPLSIEFWINSDARLHARELYTRATVKDAWSVGLLYP